MPPSPPELLAALRPLLLSAGAVALDAFRRVGFDLKQDGSEVTEADRRAEAVLVEGLARAFPQHGVVGEEGTRVAGSAGTWYVDPLDGTSSFLQGMAHWGPTVCLVEDGALVAGAFWMPRLGELYHVVAGEGAWRGDQRLRGRWAKVPGRNDAVAVPSRFHRRDRLAWPGKSRALGSTAAHLALTAGGGLQAALVPGWKLWDVGCGVLLVQEAGGRVVDLRGRAYDPRDPSGPFWAGSPAALEVLTAHPFPDGFPIPLGESAR
ncbi:MAG: inositol monophosphatase [Deltaproteobacteria bacterium]|nr:inositol monophosphatase [Deltaproteobacteria bacterium]